MKVKEEFEENASKCTRALLKEYINQILRVLGHSISSLRERHTNSSSISIGAENAY